MKIRITKRNHCRNCFAVDEVVTIENLIVVGEIYGNYNHFFDSEKDLFKYLKISYEFEEVK